MSFDRSDILRLVRMSDDDVLRWLGGQTRRDLEEAQDKLRRPLELSFAERMAARVAGIDIAQQQHRFIRLIGQFFAGE